MNICLADAKKIADSKSEAIDLFRTLKDLFTKNYDLLITANKELLEIPGESYCTTTTLASIHAIAEQTQYIPIVTLLLSGHIINLPVAAKREWSSRSYELIRNFQLSHVPYLDFEICMISRNLTEYLCHEGITRCLLRPLRRLIPCLQPMGVLTPMHADLMQACIVCQMYRVGYESMLKELILEIDPTKTGLNAIDFLRYFYYAGLCCISMRDYSMALENFIQVLATPGQAISAITIHAYKKAVLISLISTGKKFLPPKYTMSVVNRLEPHVRAYDELAELYLQNDFVALTNYVNANQSVFAKDINAGLSLRLPKAMIDQRVQRVSHTYAALSIADFANGVGIEDTQIKRWLLRMVNEKEVMLSIDSMSSMVHIDHSGTFSFLFLSLNC